MDNFFNFKAKHKLHILIRQPDVEMSIITRLGKPKFWISNSNFFEIMSKLYKRASSSAFDYYYQQTGGKKYEDKEQR